MILRLAAYVQMACSTSAVGASSLECVVPSGSGPPKTRSKGAPSRAGKDFEKVGMDLFSREIVAKVHHRGISMKKGVLLHRDKEIRAMD